MGAGNRPTADKASPSFIGAKPSWWKPKLHDEKPPLEAKPAVAKTVAAVKNESAFLVAEVTHG